MVGPVVVVVVEPKAPDAWRQARTAVLLRGGQRRRALHRGDGLAPGGDGVGLLGTVPVSCSACKRQTRDRRGHALQDDATSATAALGNVISVPGTKKS